MFGVKEDNVVGFVVAPEIVGVPVGVNPPVPYSICHVVAVPFSVHPKSAEVDETFAIVNNEGDGHDCVIPAN